jgi:hypothetical protein
MAIGKDYGKNTIKKLEMIEHKLMFLVEAREFTT